MATVSECKTSTDGAEWSGAAGALRDQAWERAVCLCLRGGETERRAGQPTESSVSQREERECVCSGGETGVSVGEEQPPTPPPQVRKY